jgi:hypothetical protein
MSKFKEVRSKLSSLAREIRETRREHKYSMRTKGVGLDRILNQLKREFRCLHIARCLSSGTPYEKIETPNERHQLTEMDNTFIKNLVEELNNERNFSCVCQD